MVFNLPTLPPPLLERCLALSEHLFAMKSGSGKLELSPSHFSFSVDHPPGNKEAGYRYETSTPRLNPMKRKKTPSDLRRNAARKKKHLDEKNFMASSASPGTSTVIPSSNTEEPPTPSSVMPPSNTEEPPTPSSVIPPSNTEEQDSNPYNMNPDNTDLPDTIMEVENQTPCSPQNVAEDPESIEEEISEDEFSEEETVREKITIGDWPEDFSKLIKNNNESLDVTVIIYANDFKTAIASLKRTFKKCNLRNIEPRKLEHEGSVNSFAFEFTIILKHLKTTFGNMKKNWIQIDESKLIGFLAKGFLFQNT